MMGCSVREAMARVDSYEFTEWLAFDRLEPIGQGRTNLILAGLSAMTANINRDREARPEPFEVEDFIPYHVRTPRPPPREATPAEVADIEHRMKAALGWRRG
jgi:hypothetical protein